MISRISYKQLTKQLLSKPSSPSSPFSSAAIIRSTNLPQVKDASDLIPSGAPTGSIPTDLDQATGLERLEILSKMAGVDVFDMQPIKFSKLGTMKDPIVIDSLDTFRYVGCTGEHESHETLWVTVSENKPARCAECGSVFKLNFIGEHQSHGHH